MPDHGGLDFQDVLAGFDQQQVRAAFDQSLRLLVEKIGQLVEGDVAQVGVGAAGQLAGGADAARHEARDAGLGGEAVTHAAGDLGRGPVDLQHALAQAVFAQGQAVGAEGIGLHRLRADGQEGGVDGLDHVRAGDDQIVVAAVVPLAAEVIGREVIAWMLVPIAPSKITTWSAMASR